MIFNTVVRPACEMAADLRPFVSEFGMQLEQTIILFISPVLVSLDFRV